MVGFPLGANTTLVKAVEAATAIQSGADEIDMVLPVRTRCQRALALHACPRLPRCQIGPLVDGNDAYVINDIRYALHECCQH